MYTYLFYPGSGVYSIAGRHTYRTSPAAEPVENSLVENAASWFRDGGHYTWLDELLTLRTSNQDNSLAFDSTFEPRSQLAQLLADSASEQVFDLIVDQADQSLILYYSTTDTTLRFGHADTGFTSIENVSVGVEIAEGYLAERNGEVHAVFRASDNRLFHAQRTSGVWSAPTLVTASATSPRIAVDSLGRPHLAYKGSNRVRHSTWNGSVWVDTDLSSASTIGGIVVGANDDIHLTYVQSSSTCCPTFYTYRLRAALYNAVAGTWTVDVLVTQRSSSSSGTLLGGLSGAALAPDGSIWMSYSTYNIPYTFSGVAKYDGSVWTTESGGGNSLVVDGDGHRYWTFANMIGSTRSGVARTFSPADSLAGGSVVGLGVSSNGGVRVALKGTTSYPTRHWRSDLNDASQRYIDSRGVGGRRALVRTGANDFAVAFTRPTNGDLVYAFDITGFTVTEVVDGAPRTPESPALAMGSDGTVHLAYRDAANGDLRYARRVVGVWSSQIAVAGADLGAGTSVTVETDGTVHIAYRDVAAGTLHYVSGSWGSWSAPQQVDGSGTIDGETSIAVESSDGHVEIAYRDQGAGSVKLASNEGGSFQTEVLASEPGSSLELDARRATDGHWHVAFDSTAGLRVAEGSAGGPWTVATVDVNATDGAQFSLDIDGDGSAWIAYRRTSGYLNLATDAMGKFQPVRIHYANTVGAYPDLRLDGDGRPIVTFAGDTGVDLYYMRHFTGVLPASAVSVASPF
jgi:hypothetical protein